MFLFNASFKEKFVIKKKNGMNNRDQQPRGSKDAD